MIRAIMILPGCLFLTGCQQAQSFMHMNSDSPSPFFGLQLAVDRDSPSVEVPSLPGRGGNTAKETNTAPKSYLAKADNFPREYGSLEFSRLKINQPNSNFSFTATENVLQGNLKMALPKVTPKSGTPEADQLADLLHRLKQS